MKALLLFERLSALVPLRLLALWSWWLSWVWWTVLPVRKKLAVQNLSLAFPDAPAGPTLRRMMDNLVLGYLEFARGLHTDDLALEVVGLEQVRAQLATGKGAVLLAGHTGSWDFCVNQLARQEGLRITALIREPSDERVAAWLRHAREGYGLRTLKGDKGVFEKLLKLLDDGELVIFHEDQRFNDGIPVPFLGRDAYSMQAAAVASKIARVPVFGCGNERLGPGRHRLTVHRTLEMARKTEVAVATCQAFLGELVTAAPHNWLWLHDRWRKP